MAQTSTRRSSNIIEIRFEVEGGRVRIVPPDRDVMAMPVEIATEACGAFRSPIRFKEQFDLLVHRLAIWSNERVHKIAAAYLTLRNSSLLFLVVMRGKEFNAQFEDEISDLEMTIARDSDYELIRFGTHLLPRCNRDIVQSFLSPQMALQLKVKGSLAKECD